MIWYGWLWRERRERWSWENKQTARWIDVMFISINVRAVFSGSLPSPSPLLLFSPSAFILLHFTFGKPAIHHSLSSACLIMFIHHRQKERMEKMWEEIWFLDERNRYLLCMWIHGQGMKIYGSARDEITGRTDHKQLRLQRLKLWRPCRVAYSKGTIQWEEIERNRDYQKNAETKTEMMRREINETGICEAKERKKRSERVRVWKTRRIIRANTWTEGREDGQLSTFHR